MILKNLFLVFFFLSLFHVFQFFFFTLKFSTDLYIIFNSSWLFLFGKFYIKFRKMIVRNREFPIVIFGTRYDLFIFIKLMFIEYFFPMCPKSSSYYIIYIVMLFHSSFFFLILCFSLYFFYSNWLFFFCKFYIEFK